jgi:predicted deacetylase
VIRDWDACGWTIAQHGYTHQCATRNRDLLAISEKTEFAGLPYDEQLASLRAGKDILTSQGVWQPVFMAPSHSFDQITLLALSDLGFRYLTDGYGLYPYRMGKLTAVPQLFASPLNFGFGIYSICLHVNTMTKTQIAHITSFVHAHRKQIISFEEAASIRCCVPWVAPTSRLLTSAALKTVRAIRKRR